MSPTNKILKTRHRWQTWWSIAGPRLTRHKFRLRSNIVIAPLSAEDFLRMKTDRAPTLAIAPPRNSFVVHYPPRDEVQSRHRLQIDVEAKNSDEACQLAQQIADRLVVSLSLAVPGGRYHVELRKHRRADEGREHTAWSQVVGVTQLTEPDHLQDSDVKKVLSLFEPMGSDPTAENAFIHLLSAWQLQATTGSKPLERSILQHYVLCVEAIVNGEMARIREARRDKIRLEERTFASEFAATLHKRADKPEAIRQASTRLREISLSNMMPSIDVIGELFTLPTTIKDQAKDLYRFRSGKLSHPGRAEREGLQKWLRHGPAVADICLADVVARAFLVGYCECQSKTAKVR